MADKVRSTKLKFKGEKTKKKRKREDGDSERVGSSSKRKLDDKDPEDWVIPEDVNELRGPTFIVHPSDPSPISINFSTTTNRIMLQSIDKDKAEDSEPVKLLDRIPTDVAQVWVITRVAGSPTINLRTGTGEGKFLSCDAHGLVSADRDARGPQEEWTPVVLPDGMVAFMNVYEKYLSVDEVAGGSLQLRGDSEEVGFAERFWLKIQYKYKKEANEEEKKRKEGHSGPPKIDEASSNHIHQTWGAGRSVVSDKDKKELKLARKEGRLAEAMLERRAKLKRKTTAKRTKEVEVEAEHNTDGAGLAFQHLTALKHPLQCVVPQFKQEICHSSSNKLLTAHILIIARPQGKFRMYNVLSDLRDAMKATHRTNTSFMNFKNIIQKYARNIDKRKYKDEHRLQDWDVFVQTITSIDKSLDRYEDCWPVEYYFNSLVRWNRKEIQKKLKPSLKGMPHTPIRPTTRNNASNKMRTTKRRNAFTALARRARSTRAPSPASSEPVEIVWDSRFDPPRAEGEINDPSTEIGSNSQPKYLPGKVTISPMLEDKFEETNDIPGSRLIAVCFLCKPSALVDPSSNTRLSLFLNDDDLLLALAPLGILFDQHLDILLQMDNDFREQMISSIPAGRLDEIMKSRLLKLLYIAAKHANNISTHANETMIIAQQPCKHHPPIDISDISSIMRNHLLSHRIGELIPALARMGVYTNDEFADFCMLGEWQRAHCINRAQLKLSEFQMFMMELAFGVRCGMV